jgi:hypothetical protein
MKQIRKDEIYNHLSEFLKGKGVELKEGHYTRGIHAGCSMLADAINLSQAGLERAKVGLERGVDQMRQVIHEKTAPKSARQADATKGPSTRSSKTKTGGGKAASGRGKRPGRRRE